MQNVSCWLYHLTMWKVSVWGLMLTVRPSASTLEHACYGYSKQLEVCQTLQWHRSSTKKKKSHLVRRIGALEEPCLDDNDRLEPQTCFDPEWMWWENKTKQKNLKCPWKKSHPLCRRPDSMPVQSKIKCFTVCELLNNLNKTYLFLKLKKNEYLSEMWRQIHIKHTHTHAPAYQQGK